MEKHDALQILKETLLVTGTGKRLWVNIHQVDLEFNPHIPEIDLNLSVLLMITKHFPIG